MSKKLVRKLNAVPWKDLPEELKPAATRTSCPWCLHSILVGRALDNGKEWGNCDDTDFTCPDCKEPLVLCKPIFGNAYYFSKGVKNEPNYRGNDV